LKDDKIYTGDQLMIAKRSKCKAVELLWHEWKVI
jgi:hypothetical protein